MIDDASLDRSHYQPDTDSRIHAAASYIVVQRAINHFQDEELAAAMKVLDT